ncbi:MAG: HlyC/CorC family transporter [Actinobacteria bacterium]|nr:HlyC/CorC family transporter [Actinomycetota bacterium]
MLSVATLLFGMLVVFAITVVTGYFVAQEFSYMAVDRSRLSAQAASGDAGSQRALRVTKRTSFMLSGAQLGITVTGLLVGYVAEPLIGQSLATLLGGVNISTTVAVVIGGIVALLFSTVVQMVFGELFPKNLAIARAEPVAVWLSRSTLAYLRLFGWLISVFDKASNLLLKMLRIEPVHDLEHSASARDLEHIVSESRESGQLPADLSLLLDRIIDFPRRPVEHAMIPRSRVDTLPAHATIAAVRHAMSQGHSRYPILNSVDNDTIDGVVHLTDLLATTLPENAPVTRLMRPPLTISHLMRLPDALTELRSTGNQFACVLDEFGGFAGVLTLEDLAEEMVGEITDEHDPADTATTDRTQQNTWVVAGDSHIDEVERTLGVDLPRDDYETISGLVIKALHRLPAVGDEVEIELPPSAHDLVDHDEPVVRTIRAEVLETGRHVPSLVRLTIPNGNPESELIARRGEASP